MQQINVNELKPHPRNTEFFDDMSGDKWTEFLESVKSRGVIEPIVVTPDKMIVSGHQRVRACKELGIATVLCDVHAYSNEDQILQDLLETNIRQRGDVGGSAKKVGKRIQELERIYGVREGSANKPETIVGEKNSFTQSDIASSMNIDVRTLRNYKLLADMIPELDELVETGIVTKTTALAMMKNLSPYEQEQLISSLDTTKKITQREVQKQIDEFKRINESEVDALENQISKLKTEKNLLERQAMLNKEDSEKYHKLKSDIEFLSKQKTDIGRQVDSATELSGLTVRLQKLLEGELAPIKFKRCMEVLDTSEVCVQNLKEIINRIDSWSDEMKQLLTNDYYDIIDVQ